MMYLVFLVFYWIFKGKLSKKSKCAYWIIFGINAIAVILLFLMPNDFSAWMGIIGYISVIMYFLITFYSFEKNKNKKRLIIKMSFIGSIIFFILILPFATVTDLLGEMRSELIPLFVVPFIVVISSLKSLILKNLIEIYKLKSHSVTLLEILFALLAAVSLFYTMGTLEFNIIGWYVNPLKIIVAIILAIIVLVIELSFNSPHLKEETLK